MMQLAGRKIPFETILVAGRLRTPFEIGHPFVFHYFQLSSRLLPAVFHPIVKLGLGWKIAGSSGTKRGSNLKRGSEVSQLREYS